MPFDDGSIEKLFKYKSAIYEIENVIKDDPNFRNVVLRDFNADKFTHLRFWKEIEDFMNRAFLKAEDYDRRPSDSFTYLSPGHDTTSWLDHVVTDVGGDVVNISIEYSFSIYDHFPIGFQLVGN